MTNTVILALNEYMKAGNVPAQVYIDKYKLTPSEFWSGYAKLKARVKG